MTDLAVLFLSLQAANSYLRDQWFHSLQWKVSPDSAAHLGVAASISGLRAGLLLPRGMKAEILCLPDGSAEGLAPLCQNIWPFPLCLMSDTFLPAVEAAFLPHSLDFAHEPYSVVPTSKRNCLLSEQGSPEGLGRKDFRGSGCWFESMTTSKGSTRGKFIIQRPNSVVFTPFQLPGSLAQFPGFSSA